MAQGAVSRRNFRLLWGGGLVADVAIGAFVFSTPLVVLERSGDVLASGVTAGVVGAGALIGRIPGGTLADRYDRRRLMLASQGVQTGIFALLALLIAIDELPTVLYVVLAAAAAVVSAFNDAAENVAIAQVVPPDQLTSSHGAYQGRAHAANLLGPAVGGVLLSVGHLMVPLAAAVACLVALVCNLLMRGNFSPKTSAGDPFLDSTLGGVRIVLSSMELRRILAMQFCKNIATTGAMFLMVLSLSRAGIDTGIIGLLSSLLGACGIAGAALVPLATKTLSRRGVLLVSNSLALFCVALVTVLSGSWLMALPLALSVLASPSSGAVTFAWIAGVHAKEELGRILSIQTVSGSGGGVLARPSIGGLYGVCAPLAGALCVISAAAALLISTRIWRSEGRAMPTS